MASHFEVDKQGLAQILERRGKAFALFELWQNAVDERGVTNVDMTLEPISGRPAARLRVEDDSPHGWKRLSDAFTLFAPSYKRDNPEQRGRFNLGEKLVIAACDEATISTVQGEIVFDAAGRHEYPRRKRERGSVFEGTLRMTRAELEEACRAVRLLIVPPGVSTKFNGEILEARPNVAEFKATLLTEVADREGYLKRVERPTRVSIHDLLAGEGGRVYELGIPVAETGDRWDVNVHQRVPLNLERDGISSAYLRKLRTHTLNATARLLSQDDAQETWVENALEGKEIEREAVHEIITKRHGPLRVIQDPSDVEAGRIAVSKGYEVIGGRSYSGKAWANIKEHGAALPAGKVTPSPKPFSPDGRPLSVIAESDQTPEERNLAQYAVELHSRLIGGKLSVLVTKDRGWPFRGAYGNGQLYINVSKLRGRGPCIEVDAFLIHEFAHHYGGHLTEGFDDALAEIGAKMVELVRESRFDEVFNRQDPGSSG